MKKIEILRSTKNLKGSSIRISKDLTRQQLLEEKILRMYLIVARSNKQNFCYIKNSALCVNDHIYAVSDLESLLGKGENILQLGSRSDPGTPSIRDQTDIKKNPARNLPQSLLPPQSGVPTPIIVNTEEGQSTIATTKSDTVGNTFKVVR